jgi:hypothetical protein
VEKSDGFSDKVRIDSDELNRLFVDANAGAEMDREVGLELKGNRSVSTKEEMLVGDVDTKYRKEENERELQGQTSEVTVQRSDCM